MKRKRRALTAAYVASAALLLAACAGYATSATNITSASATLTASGSCSGGSPTRCNYYWEWGTVASGGYANQSPVQVNGGCGPNCNVKPASLTYSVSRLTPNTAYQYKICGEGDNTSAYVCVGTNPSNGIGSGTASTFTTRAASGGYTRPPKSNGTDPDQWYWEIDPPSPGVAGLPATSAAHPAPGSANIWDTDLFQDSNTASAGIPTGASPVVTAIHGAGHYSICYVEAGAYQIGFPDDSDFAAADYGNASKQHQMQGYSNEWWFDTRGFAKYNGNASSLTGAAPNIAQAIAKRIGWCKLEGQDALEPDDLDGYTNQSASGAAGGGWGLTQADAVGYEYWLADTAHADGMAIFQKNDPANASVDEPIYDGAITEECNYYDDPCSGSGGDWNAYLSAGKPVLNAEYTSDGETTAKFCPVDKSARIIGALFDVNLDGKTYTPCQA